MSGAHGDELIERLRHVLAEFDPQRPAAENLRLLIASKLDRLPLPGRGATLVRWQALAEVAAFDLSLAKLYEGHTDALAILAELGVAGPDSSSAWGTWAAEAPQGRTTIEPVADGADGELRLSGAKCWCSGAATADHGLLTAWFADGAGPQLVRVDLRQPGVTVDSSAWRAVGMAESASLDVTFDAAIGHRVGAPGDYLSRPGFWQGGAGIGACWFGGALSIARSLRAAVEQGSESSNFGFRLAALGRVDLVIRSTAALLREAAGWIDAHPAQDASDVALRVRLHAEATATTALSEVGRALGATPYCRDARYARMAADLPVFLRQSHAERDLAALGARVADSRGETWPL